MLALRRLDAAGRRELLDELRPRFVLVRVRARRVRVAWPVPLGPLEELAAFALGAASLAMALGARLPLPSRWTRTGSGALDLRPAGRDADVATVRALVARLDDLAGGALRDVLRLPSGEPYLSVRSGDTAIDLTVL